GHLTRRDEASPSDWIGILIDSYHDRRTAFEFLVNPAGVLRDVYHYNDVEEDPSWNAPWEARVSRDTAGWSAEFRIPFSTLRFSRAEQYLFGFNVYRRINRLNEIQYWRLLPRGSASMVALFGDLHGIEGIAPPRQIEVSPYLLSQAVLRDVPSGAETAGPTGTIGADFKLGITSNLTLTGAVNPDFGQVEADPARVNLSAFESYYADQRPFFTEGTDIFQFPTGTGVQSPEQLFYTRRIGRQPQLEADARGGAAETIDQTTILGAAKLTGKTPSGWSVGLMGALTAEERARVIDGSGAEHHDLVEPRTGYLVGRVARDFRAGRTVVGVFGTGMHRDLPAGLDLREGAYVGGAEFRHRFANDGYALRAWVAGSRVTGSPAAIAATQRSSVHYFQRPDIGYASLDTTRTALSGVAGLAAIEKRAGVWRWSATAMTRSAGFETNDVGFQFWAGRTVEELSLTRRWLTPGPVFRALDLQLTQFGEWTRDGERVNLGGRLGATYTLANYWTGSVSLWRRVGGFNPVSLRGGPALRQLGNWYLTGGLSTDERRPFQAGFDGEWWHNDDGETHGVWLGTYLRWRPSGRYEFSIGPEFSDEHEGRQFVAGADVNGRAEYLVGRSRLNTLSLTLRANVAVTPDLTIQLYGQPFASALRYRQFRRVLDPRARGSSQFEDLSPSQIIETAGGLGADLDRDGTADLDLGQPEFTESSLAGSMVVRWEFRTFSTLYLVWRHSRSYDRATGGSLGGALDNLARAPAENTLLVKLSYWMKVR
ncbi:MAG: DUF5916 domain-containing protein, partial [Gemmatimonadales bacterium]